MQYFEFLKIETPSSWMVPSGRSAEGKGNGDLPKIATPFSPTRKKVLIVEDEVLVAENLKESIERAGFSVVAVLSTGEEAIRVLTKSEVDIILMDIRLGGALNGMETMDVVHETLKQIPVVFVTAYEKDLFPHLTRISPALYRYISKPYDQPELENAIQELLALKH